MLRTPDPGTFRKRAALLRAKAQSLRARDPSSAWQQLKGSAAKVDVEEGRHDDRRGLLTSLLCETIEGEKGGEERPEGDPEACFAVRDALARECSVAWRGLDLTQPGGNRAAAEGAASLLDVLSACAVSPDRHTDRQTNRPREPLTLRTNLCPWSCCADRRLNALHGWISAHPGLPLSRRTVTPLQPRATQRLVSRSSHSSPPFSRRCH